MMAQEVKNSSRWKLIRNCLMIDLLEVHKLHSFVVAAEIGLSENSVKSLHKKIIANGIDSSSI
jgi:hypothetical protein